MDEADVRRILGHPLSMVGSDGLPEDPFPHPRLWGAFPRVLGYFSRDVGLFPLHTAVHKMTGLSAALALPYDQLSSAAQPAAAPEPQAQLRFRW